MNRLVTVIASERQIRAGTRVLRQLLFHDHPMVRRAILDALNDCSREDAIQFTAKCEASLLRQTPTEPLAAPSGYRPDSRD